MMIAGDGHGARSGCVHTTGTRRKDTADYQLELRWKQYKLNQDLSKKGLNHTFLGYVKTIVFTYLCRIVQH